MTACCCASPDCRVNGCSIQRGLEQPAAEMWPTTPRIWPTMPPPILPPMPLTAEDVRRIVREELLRALQELAATKVGG